MVRGEPFETTAFPEIIVDCFCTKEFQEKTSRKEWRKSRVIRSHVRKVI